MKSLSSIVAIFILLPILLIGQKKSASALTISEKQFTLSSTVQSQSGTVILPFLEGKATAGSKEQFGLLFKNAHAKKNMIEILDAGGKVLKGVTLNDFLGKTKNNGVKLLSVSISNDNRFSEAQHEIKLPSGTITLITGGMLSGDKSDVSAKEQIIMTFSIVSAAEQTLGLRLSLPIDGTAEVKGSGVVLSGKSAPASVAVSVLSRNEKLEVQKNMLTVQSPTVTVKGETPVLWLVASASTAASLSGAKTAAAEKIESASKENQDPNLVIINTASRADAQPGDTVVYSLVCKNIGAGEATNIQLTNPIPTGTSYIDGSATENGTELSLEKETVPPPQESSVKSIKWILKEPLKSGKEFTVNFKVIIR